MTSHLGMRRYGLYGFVVGPLTIGSESGCVRKGIRRKNVCSKNPYFTMSDKLYGQSTALGTPWATPLAYDKQKGGEPGGTAVRSDRIYEGAKLEAPQGCRLRVGCLNVGSLSKRSGEVVELAARRRLDFCSIQESRWKGEGARLLGGDGARYKLYWKGRDTTAASGVGILVAEKYVDKVVEVRRVSDRLIVLRVVVGRMILNVISAYAPQRGRPNEEKEEFWVSLSRTVAAISSDEKLIVCGDMNGHVGENAQGFEGVHGGNGFGERNVEGEMLLEFAEAMELAVVNTWFRKEACKRITYESGEDKSQIDFVLVRRSELSSVKDIKVIAGEECIQQHRLLVCVLDIKQQLKKVREKPMSRCRVWKLKDESVLNQFRIEVQRRLAEQQEGNVEGIWEKLKGGLLETAEKVCGHTKGRSKHRETWWWNEEVAKAIQEKRRLFKIWKKSKCEEDRKLYNQAKKFARAEVAKAQETARKDFVDKLDEAEHKGHIFKVAKQIVQKNRDVVGGSCVKDKNGKLVMEEDKIKEVWAEYFEKLLNEEFQWKKEDLEHVSEVPAPIERITFGEVKAAIAKAKDGKAPGPTGVVAEMLKAAGDVGIQWMTDLCNAVVVEGKIPDDWKKSWMVSVYKGKGDALECGSYRGIKLLDQVMKVLERVIEKRLRDKVQIDNMQFGFRPGRGTTDAIFIVRQMQEKFLAKRKELWMAFVDLEKAFDRVPREVVWWALRKMGVEEWLVKVIQSMYADATTAVRLGGGESKAFAVKVGVHQGSVLSPLLFTIVLEALSRTFRVGLPWELLYADDLVLMAESEEKLMDKLRRWRHGFEEKGLKVNVGKTKVMRCSAEPRVVRETVKFPCSICMKSVGSNSIRCVNCHLWVHKKCSGVKGPLKNDDEYKCMKCKNLETATTEVSAGRKENICLEKDVSVECVEEFCYLGDMLGFSGGAGEASRMRVKCAWKKFRELSPILTTRGASLALKGKIYSACVRSVMIYGSETWPMKVEDMQRLVRAENMMVRHMCGVTLKARKSSEELRQRLGIESVTEVVRRGRLRWFGHVERKADDDWVRACQRIEVEGKRCRGRGRKTWRECVVEDLKVLGLREEEAQNRLRWRRGIRGDRLTCASTD
ncbi:MAG TPA: reverse transcriptase domain-containing protein [Terriglobia bacterium]|nr:reverse transcriptase domain-containing protein [Terriglobia bacterium]